MKISPLRTALPLVALLISACAQPDSTAERGVAQAEAAPAEAPAGTAAEAPAISGRTYGEPLTLSQVTPISSILDNPDQWVGQRVLVEGMVVEVCEKRGCWVDIASDRAYEKIQIKVEDGDIVFPLTARGQQAWVEGVVEELNFTYEEALERAEHRAEEQGVEFDPSTVTGPETHYRIWGYGAVIADPA